MERKWNGSQAERVCEACFEGDICAMKKYARARRAGRDVKALGRDFREIVHNQNRAVWWKRAEFYIDAELKHRLDAGEVEPEESTRDKTLSRIDALITELQEIREMVADEFLE